MTSPFSVTHARVNTVADDPAVEAAGGVNPSHWNAGHTIAGLDDLATNVRGAVAIAATGSTYTMSATESLNNNILFTSSYAGAVTVNYYDQDINPASIIFCNYSEYAVTFIAAGTSLTIPALTFYCIGYAYGIGSAIISSPANNNVRVSVDFGGSFTDKAQTVVTGQTWVTANSCIVPQILTASGTDPDEMYLLGIRAEISNLVVGDGFTVTLYSESEAKGSYSVMCLGV